MLHMTHTHCYSILFYQCLSLGSYLCLNDPFIQCPLSLDSSAGHIRAICIVQCLTHDQIPSRGVYKCSVSWTICIFEFRWASPWTKRRDGNSGCQWWLDFHITMYKNLLSIWLKFRHSGKCKWRERQNLNLQWACILMKRERIFT